MDVCFCDGELHAFFGGPVLGIFPHVVGVVLDTSGLSFFGDAGFTVAILWFEHGGRALLSTGGTGFGLAEEALCFFQLQDVPSLPSGFHALLALGFDVSIEGCWVFYATGLTLVRFLVCCHVESVDGAFFV
jgi:hypothetical protein